MPNLIESLASSEITLSLVATIAGTVWSFVKSSEWLQGRHRRRVRRAAEIVEAAVEETYRAYVQAIKAGRADGKLTADERRKARLVARERALQMARRNGLDLTGLLGDEGINLSIARGVKRLKAA
jgi:hypothetical protein